MFISKLIVTAKNYSTSVHAILHCNFFTTYKNVTFTANCCAKIRDICATTLTKCDILIPQKITVFVLFFFVICTWVHYNDYIIKCVIIFLKKWHFCTFVPKPRHLCNKTEQKCDLFTKIYENIHLYTTKGIVNEFCLEF